MKVIKITSLVGFLLALSALNPPVADAKANQSKGNTAKPTIEGRLAAIAKVLKERENRLHNSSETRSSSSSNSENATELAQFRNSFRNGGGFRNNGDFRNGGGFRNSGGFRNNGDFRNGGAWRNGGDFRNGGGWGNWRNGWRDGGGFLNFRNS